MNLYLSLVLAMFSFKNHTIFATNPNSAGLTANETVKPKEGIVGKIKTGFATYYATRFEGRKTTSGAAYRGEKYTAAHLKYPFGTVLTVKNVKNGRTVDVTVNDRGPYSKKFSIDLSSRAAKELGFYGNGVAHVEYFVKE